MQISEIKIRPVKPDAKGLIAFASCIVDEWLYLGSIGVVTTLSGDYRILYPTKKVAGKDFHHFHPITKDASRAVENAIVEKTKEVFNL